MDATEEDDLAHCSTLNVSHTDILYILGRNRYEGLPDMLIFNSAVSVALLAILLLIPTRVDEYSSPEDYTKYVFDCGVRINKFVRFVLSRDWMYMKEEVFLQLYDQESYHLLRFQRYLIISLVLMSSINLCIIMPINIKKGDNQFPDSFSASTLGNLSHRSPYVWAHIIVGNLHTLIIMVVMRQFVSLPSLMNKESAVIDWFAQKYPWTRIRNVSFVYKIKLIEKLKTELRRVEKVLSVCTKEDKTFRRTKLLGCFYGSGRKNAKSFYESMRCQILEDINEEKRKRIIEGPLHWAFVEFESNAHAKFIMECEKYYQIKETTFEILPAPSEDNIEWGNFTTNFGALMRDVFVNLGLFLTFIFFTTPQIIMGSLDDILTMIYFDKNVKVPSLIKSYIPIILTSIIGKASIFFVMLSTRLLGITTQTKINQKILTRGSAYFLFIVLILPAFGSLSIESLVQLYWNLFIEGSIGNNKNKSRWECIFLPNSGVFFIDYLITSAFFGNVFQLRKVKCLMKFILDTIISSSWLEVRVRNEEGMGKVWFGQEYAYFIVQFFIGAALGVSCPWVTVFALLFMIIRHLVDTDHFQGSYESTKLGVDFYVLIVSIAIGGTLFQQFFTSLFLSIKSYGEDHFLKAEMFSALLSIFFTFVTSCELSNRWKKIIPIINMKRIRQYI
ncbi:CSC1-like protein 1 isoform X2 [Lepeophtheirus salmonis]|uniref:CSC1-like protein 1 isoform X2 n=1 Tax=Lepeophtheirus salmonis TaxID=72036 RepID=UPI003AF38C0C